MKMGRRPASHAVRIVDRPLRLVRDGEWLLHAACANEDVSLFYDTDHETPAARQQRVTIAKSICGGCSVRKECLETALANEEPYGVWGGFTASERYTLKRIMETA
jgi:WhiB family redox-sensing transcriptional regulator